MEEQDERLLALQGIVVTENNTLGISCGKCGCNDFYTDRTLKHEERVVRYKHCRHCGTKIRTTERLG